MYTDFYSVSACYGSAAISEYNRPEKLQHYLPWCNPLTGLTHAKNTLLKEQKKEGPSLMVKPTTQAYTLIFLSEFLILIDVRVKDYSFSKD